MRAIPAASSIRTLLLASTGFVAAACDGAPGPSAAASSRPLLPEREFLAQIDHSRGWKDCYTPVRDGTFVPVAGAHGVADDEWVLGADLGTAQVCYSTVHLNAREIVEHTLAGLELLACW